MIVTLPPPEVLSTRQTAKFSGVAGISATVKLDSSETHSWFRHITIVLFRANVLEAFTCRMDVKFVMIPLPTMLVRVIMNGRLGIDCWGEVKSKVIGVVSGLSHWRDGDWTTWQVKVTSSPLQANRLPFSPTVEVSTTLPTTEIEQNPTINKFTWQCSLLNRYARTSTINLTTSDQVLEDMGISK